MNQGIDKRRFARVSVNFVTVEVYKGENQAEDPELCFVINLSENGMMFRAERTYDQGQRLLLTFSIADRDIVIRTDALTVHRRETESSKFYGVQFKDLGLAEHTALKAYVKALLESPPA